MKRDGLKRRPPGKVRATRPSLGNLDEFHPSAFTSFCPSGRDKTVGVRLPESPPWFSSLSGFDLIVGLLREKYCRISLHFCETLKPKAAAAEAGPSLFLLWLIKRHIPLFYLTTPFFFFFVKCEVKAPVRHCAAVRTRTVGWEFTVLFFIFLQN